MRTLLSSLRRRKRVSHITPVRSGVASIGVMRKRDRHRIRGQTRICCLSLKLPLSDKPLTLHFAGHVGSRFHFSAIPTFRPGEIQSDKECRVNVTSPPGSATFNV